MGPRHHLSFCACITGWLAPELLVSMGPSSHLWLLHAKQRPLEKNKSLCWSQTSSVVLCMKTSVISIRITSLWGCQPSSVIFACKRATIGPELQVAMGPRPHQSFCACKTAWFASDWQVYMGYSPHLCFFLHAKQRLLDQFYKSVWVPDLICNFEHTLQRA